MQKTNSGWFAAGKIKQIYRGAIDKFVASDNTFSYMSSVTGILAYYKQLLYRVLAVMKQLGIIPYFLTLSCADLRREELLQTYISNLNKLRLSEKELENLSYNERCNFLKNNPLLVARNRQYKVDMLFKEN